MNLYRGIIEYFADDIVWDFEAENDEEAFKIVDQRASSVFGKVKKKLYLIGKRIK